MLIDFPNFEWDWIRVAIVRRMVEPSLSSEFKNALEDELKDVNEPNVR